jgi:hypothetical protein
MRNSYLFTPSSRTFSAASHTLLVYDYFLTLGDEVSLALHNEYYVENMATGLVHLERPMESRESPFPYQPLWKPSWANFHSAGRGWPPH